MSQIIEIQLNYDSQTIQILFGSGLPVDNISITLLSGAKGDPGTSGGGLTVMPDATDADITMQANAVLFLDNGVITQPRNINIPTPTGYAVMKFVNLEKGFAWNLIGTPVYLADGSTVLTQLYINDAQVFEWVGGKWRTFN